MWGLSSTKLDSRRVPTLPVALILIASMPSSLNNWVALTLGPTPIEALTEHRTTKGFRIYIAASFSARPTLLAV